MRIKLLQQIQSADQRINTILFSGSKSQDFYAVGDLTGKLGYTETTGWDNFLPLSGPQSIFHRSVAIYK